MVMQNKTDVCLILEGTYPYVTGGVATWVHQLICGLSEFTFALAVILPHRDDKREYGYELPPNVKEIRRLYLHDMDLPSGHQGKLADNAWDQVEAFHTCPVMSDQLGHFAALYRAFFDADSRGLAPAKILGQESAWAILKRLYAEHAEDDSFVDYFWTCRFIHHPIFKCLSADLPEASVYHTLSTGYAGLLATVGKLKYGRPVLLTEHGIYTRERRLEIGRVDWIYEKDDRNFKLRRSQSRFKELWNNMFATLSRLCYAHSDRIITLFQRNQAYQIEDGAPPEKLMLIPNAVDVGQLSAIAKQKKAEPDQLVLGLVARVVHIKDVKTFIRACRSVHAAVPRLKVYIMGPTDIEPDYHDECVKLVDFLGLSQVIEFTGKVNVQEYYSKLDILALSSISEAQPLVILEANCVGIPVVATDVGACRELLYGSTPEDTALGKSGLVVSIMDSKQMAETIIKIWRSRELRETMGEIGKKRVKKYYDRRDLLDNYRQLYADYMAISHPPSPVDPNFRHYAKSGIR